MTETLRAALERMPDHFPVGVKDGLGYDPDDHECATCGEDWPCPTSALIGAVRAALQGDADAPVGGLPTNDEPKPGNLFGEQSRRWLVDKHGEATVMDFEYAFWRASKRAATTSSADAGAGGLADLLEAVARAAADLVAEEPYGDQAKAIDARMRLRARLTDLSDARLQAADEGA
jgi:hypothetical protein